MKLLIIGGSGIISGEVCAAALNNGDEVTIFNRGRRPEQLDKRAKLVAGNIREESAESIAARLDGEYDVVADFLSYTPEHVEKTLEIVKNRCKQYIFASSATAYNDIGDAVYTESVPVGECFWSYAQQKADCEYYLRALDLPCKYTIVRPYVTYGRTRLPYQVAPLQYYTIIDRIKKHKPIMICNENTRCTLTYAPEFAVGVYGLMLNEKAYGEAFHVTTHHNTTWGHVIRAVAERLGEPLELVDIPREYLLAHRDGRGVDIDEILGDKSRDMVLDNAKIRSAVPAFRPDTDIDKGLDAVFEFFSEPHHQIVNAEWDAALDAYIEEYIKNCEK